MRKRTLFASIALIVHGAGAASAADLPAKAPPPEYVAPQFSWTGFYVGGNIGAVWANNTWDDTLFGLNFDNGNNARLIIGGEVGFNYQMGNFVVGVEGDFDWANNYNNDPTVVVPAAVPVIGGNTLQLQSDNNWIATAAARFGYAVDRALFYVKGGGGWVQHNSLTIVNWTTGASITGFNDNNSQSGWLVGGGIEWAAYYNWTVKIEYDYLGLGSRTITVPVTAPFLAGDTFSTGNRNVQEVKLGFNYLFNWGGPVVARY